MQAYHGKESLKQNDYTHQNDCDSGNKRHIHNGHQVRTAKDIDNCDDDNVNVDDDDDDDDDSQSTISDAEGEVIERKLTNIS